MNKKWKKIMAMGIAALLLGGCESATQTNDQKSSATSQAAGENTQFVIGGNWELSGSASAYGIVQDNAIKMAVKERNAKGGVNGQDVKYVSYDNKSDANEAATGATYLTDQKHATVEIGPSTTGSTEAAIPVVTNAKVPLISATATGDDVTLDKSGKTLDYVFRVCFQDSFQGGAMATFANKQGYDKAAVIMDNSSPYGQNLAKTFKAAYKGKIVSNESYISGDTDFQSILTNVKNAGANTIFIAGYYQEAGPIIKQAREMGIDCPILGPDGFGSEAIIDLAGKKNWTNIYYAAHFVETKDASKETKDFLANYKKEYGQKPDMFAALAYDAANLAMDAAEKTGSNDPQAIRNALAKVKDFKGVTGTFSMDDKHNPVKTVFIQEVQDGKVSGSTAIQPDEIVKKK